MRLSPVQYTHQNGLVYANLTSKDHKKSKGQYFTPVKVAEFMASLVQSSKTTVKVCDPGCGHGILTCALIERLVSLGANEIRIDLFEQDDEITALLAENMEYLRSFFPDVSISYNVHETNYLVWANMRFKEIEESYDFIISNPPYFKLKKGDISIQAVDKFVRGITNIYAGFIVASIRLLKTDGEMVFIVPRSFTSGLYFKTLRQFLFKEIRLKYVHLFASRTKTFKEDKVLQETIIFKASNLEGTTTEISVSDGVADLGSLRTSKYQITELVDVRSADKILHLPTCEADFRLIQRMRQLPYRLSDHRVKVSTGRVVAFRASDYLSDNKKDDSVPLVWMNAIQAMKLSWPVKNFAKPQYISKGAHALLVPKGRYILQRRFSAKEDKRRLICCPIKEEDFSYEQLGFENKTNFFHKIGGEFSEEELVGLCVLLNSSFYDRYFRMINGNINVSSTEMNLLPMPSTEKVEYLGEVAIAEGLTEQPEAFDALIDRIVFSEKHFLVTV